MELESRSYHPDHALRPRPHIVLRPESSLLIVTTAWTFQNEAEKITDLILNQIEQLAGEDVTTFQTRAAALDEGGNRLREALTIAGSVVFRGENSKQARLLVETVVIQIQKDSLHWAQVGQPNLFLLRDGHWAPLAVEADLSVTNPALPPLPRTGLGLDSQTRVASGSMRLSPGDRLLLLADSWLPPQIPNEDGGTFAQLTQSLIHQSPERPFWCGLLSF